MKVEVVGLKVDIVHYHIPRQLRDRKLFHDLLLLLLKFREIDFTEKNPISALSAEIYSIFLEINFMNLKNKNSLVL